MTREEAIEQIYNIGYNHVVGRDDLIAFGVAIEALKNSEQTAESSQNVSNDDSISRKAAIDALEIPKVIDLYDHYWNGRNDQYKKDVDVINNLPSAQPEIIRCKDCKYRDENWRRVSVKWLPCMDVRTGSNWYCGSADREGEQDE